MSTAVSRLAEEYNDAWNAGDSARIAGYHAADGLFRMNLAGRHVAQGRQEIEETFRFFLAMWSELRFDPIEVRASERFLAFESWATGRLRQPLTIGPLTVAPEEAVTFTGVDLITLDDDGLIDLKSSYFDLLAAADDS